MIGVGCYCVDEDGPNDRDYNTCTTRRKLQNAGPDRIIVAKFTGDAFDLAIEEPMGLPSCEDNFFLSLLQMIFGFLLSLFGWDPFCE